MTDSSNVTLLAIWAQARQRGFLGPGEYATHLRIAEGFARQMSTAAGKGIDLGSGAGVPGLALALWNPAQHWVLLDSMARRCAFLRSSVTTLNLERRVEVVEQRAESYAQENRESFDVVTARGFGAPSVVVECAAPLLKLGGCCIVSEPEPTPERWKSTQACETLESLGMELQESSPHFAVLEKVAATGMEYPRRVGIPRKRPLF